MTAPLTAQKLSSGCTRAQRCIGIKTSADGKLVFEAQGNCVVVRSTKTGEVVHHLRSASPPSDPTTNAHAEKVRLRYRNQYIRAHFETQYKNPHPDDDAATVAAHKAVWIQRQVDKFVIPADFLSHVTAFALHPTKAGQLLVATADHMLRVWDIAQGSVLESFTLDSPAVWLHASPVDPSLLLLVLNETARLDRMHAVALSKETKEAKKNDGAAPAIPDDLTAEEKKAALKQRKKDEHRPKWMLNLHGLETTHWKLVSYNLSKGAVEEEHLQRKFMPFYGAHMQQRSIPSDYIAAVAVIASSQLFYLRVGVKNTGDVAPRVVTVNRFEHVITGDSMGQMQVWRHLDTAGKGLQPSKLHWHAHRVGCVAYSRDGSYVASGGEEFVLVLWHLESGRRQYMPRLSAALSGIATKADGSGYLVACQDNSILSFNPVTNSHEWQKGGLGRVGLSASKTLVGRRMVVEPWANTLAVQAKSLVGHIQFYNPLQDRVVATLALTQRNQVSRTDDEAPIRTYASQICFAPAARTMATVTTTLDECVLRFWSRKSDGTFAMHTDVDMPHGDHVVTATASHGGVVVTADDHGEFRLWHDPTSNGWTCRSLAQFRQVSIGAVAFSHDGSLLAVAYGALLTLWDPVTNVLQSVLSYPNAPIKDIVFAAHSPHVAVRTPSGVYVWSLLTTTVAWFYNLPATCLALSPDSDQLVIAVVTKAKTLDVTTHVLAFDIASPHPTALHRLPQVDAAAIVFYKKRLVVMDTVSHVYVVGDEHAVVTADAVAPVRLQPESSALQKMYGTSLAPAAVSQANDNDSHIGGEVRSQDKGLFDAPAHVLPPLRSLYRSFLDTILLAKDEGTNGSSGREGSRVRKLDENSSVPAAKKHKDGALVLREEKPEDTYAALKKVFSKK
ncbi:hypothetical protein DYB37_000330 [Aphanomyces astaci]|uniref:WD repeat-containing protein 75 second beta-propeller domain-containing protein n=1 Tax=Aphanomyces astaci TaxID=112090 RepID=A0A3R7A4Z7_APHAT|nr:hypothetical protein DYB35_000271 [Aphanomyces astaci]RHZ29061.1 hypothetical protein DYB37_000330 [Aphanomyces astaci]